MQIETNTLDILRRKRCLRSMKFKIRSNNVDFIVRAGFINLNFSSKYLTNHFEFAKSFSIVDNILSLKKITKLK